MSVATLSGGRYRIERLLGSGGMAVVYCAHDEELSRTVAVKLPAEHLAEDEEFRARFLREARVAARLSHPNVVAVYDAGEDEGRPFIVMEVVEGETLAAVLARRGRLRPDEVVDLGGQAAAGLEHAHSHGLVHRDVKPHNLLLRDDGVLKVADFGIARAATATQRLTRVGTILGTAAYLAPEQALGEDVAATADVYSLGAVLYECLTGQTPFRADTLIQLVTAQQQSAIVPVAELVPGVPPALEEAVMRCLARNPDYRPASAGAAGRLLAGVSDAPTAPMPRPATQGRRRLRIAVLLAIVMCLALALVAIVVSSGGGTPRPAAPPPDRPDHPAQQARDLATWLRAVGD
jgi:eukaryotic-like serine/threonine-protein kinase